ncbi:MAG: glutathione S-transferase family protein [Rhizobiales bacterium]|nr:glutathione S-transferase family protein [Hyphomicrobiales bacterium]
MLKIINFKICPFVERVTALLEHKKIEYEIEYIDLSNKPKWFLEIAPNGQVPVLITENGKALFESDAIVEYLEEAYVPLQENISAEDRAENRAWSYLATKHYLVQCAAQRSSNLALLNERVAKLGKLFDKVEAKLGAHRFFNGSELSMVDIAWLPLLHRASIIQNHSGFDFLGNRPKLKKWQMEILDLGLAQKAVAPDFVEAFSKFYLSDKTYLGRGYELEIEPNNENFKTSCG